MSPQILADVILPDGTHVYWSTWCRHGLAAREPALHRKCAATEHAPGIWRDPAQCKGCGAPCVCPCHE